MLRREETKDELIKRLFLSVMSRGWGNFDLGQMKMDAQIGSLSWDTCARTRIEGI